MGQLITLCLSYVVIQNLIEQQYESMTNLIKRIVLALAFIITAIIVSQSMSYPALESVNTLANEIFRTNCLIIFSEQAVDVNQTQFSLPSICSTIHWMMPISFVSNGLVILFFSVNKVTSFISILNLLGFTFLYCNPIIDPSFICFSHFLQIMTCVLAFSLIILKSEQIDSKNHAS